MASSFYHSMVPQPTFVPPAQNTVQQESPKEKKKRTRNPENWKKEKRKRAILSGQAYVNTKGELVGPRAIGPDCNCKNKCFTVVSDDNRNAIFNGYYSLNSYDEQNAYLYGLIRRHDIQRKRKPVSERRTCSYKYYVRIKGKELQVCKKAFANIHGISDKKIRTLCIKHEQNILFPRDNRGRHKNRPKKVTPELVTLIKHHILKMLSGPNGSDFIKTDKNQGPDVNISKLHKNFLQQYEPEAIDPESDKVIKDYDAKVKSWLYFKVFHEEFKSMDFNTVKRKLSDLRKSLEASGALQSTKKKTTKQSRPRPRPQENQGARINTPNEASTSSIGVAVSAAPTTQMSGYMGGQQPPPLPPNLQLSVLGLQHLGNNAHAGAAFNPAVAQQPQQQPLNLQTGGGGGGGQGGEQPQPLPLNLHSMGGHMPSYYLSLGHMSNLISLPVSSGGGVQTGNAQTGNFPTQHNMQQFNPGSILPTHSVAQAAPGPTGQPHVLQGGVGVTYTGGQHNHSMY
ncbi:uncharacterized protein LOC119576110 [Penaeus monodon]|uniref:uncharacterized protein LOC119576110 n=2 Tax=Penaeus TaxID=133894 RepID=UPI0018A6EF39|nr:uncharacterized protein LOC119576110 [Penaeus monodon]